MPGIARRKFLLCLGGATGLAAGAGLAGRGAPKALWNDGSGRPDENDQDPIQRTRWALGSNVTMSAWHANPAVARRAIDAAFRELETVEAVMSIYRPESQLAQLNRAGRIDHPHPYLIRVLTAAREMSEESNGAFDITIQPLWSLFHRAQREERLPDDAEIAAAVGHVDWRRVEVSPEGVRLTGHPHTAITLNGIAQGFAADCVARTLREHGVEHALVDAGELCGLGSRPGEAGWKVGIQHPRHDDAYISLARLAGRCLATSGDYATKFSDDHRWHHLFDPRTGRSPGELMSVSIAAPTAMLADALSTAAFVLGADEGARLVERTPGADAFFVLKNGRTLGTRGFPFADA